MRYVGLCVLLCGCSGNVFSAASDGSGGSGGTLASGGGGSPMTGGSPSGGVGGSGGALASGGTSGSGNGGERLDASLGSQHDGGDAHEAAAPFTACPPSPPGSESACIGDFDCAYGAHPRVTCRPVYQCRRGAWLLSMSTCDAPTSCASSPGEPPSSGKMCTKSGDYCTWSSGELCTCVPPPSGQGALAWQCAAPPALPCSKLPPNEGQPCSGESADAAADSGTTATCAYGLCGGPNRVVATCEAGTWRWSFPLCN